MTTSKWFFQHQNTIKDYLKRHYPTNFLLDQTITKDILFETYSVVNNVIVFKVYKATGKISVYKFDKTIEAPILDLNI